MPAPSVERRLAAILAADVVGYSRLMERDETGTLERLKACRKEVVEPLLAERRGRLVKLMGDGLLCEFASIVDAVCCAVQIQAGVTEHNAGLAEAERIVFRIGVSLGDVLAEDGDIYGEAVNLAARLQALAQPSDICVSGQVHDEVRSKLPYCFDHLGERSLKNIERPVRVYTVRPATEDRTGVSGGSGSLPALSDRLSLAVLPFANLSGDPQQEPLADGITEDVITDLTRFRDLDVIARHSSFGHKSKAVDARQVGQELGVRYVLGGSLQRQADRIRVSAQLVDIAALPSVACAELGVFDNRIVFGQSAAFEGPAAALGLGMREGILAAFSEANAAGGVNGHTLDLVSYDDGYEPEKAIANTKRLIDQNEVFALVGEVGTPTSNAAQPIATEAGVQVIGHTPTLRQLRLG